MNVILNKRWAVVIEISAIICLQCGSSVAKLLFHSIGPEVTTFLRVGLSGILLSLLFRPNFTKFNKEQWKGVIFYGISTGAMNLLFYYGIQRVPLGIGVSVEFVGPLGVALLASRRKLDFLWAFLALAGILLLVPWKAQENSVDLIGLLLVIAAGIFWALYIVAGSKIANKIASTDAVACGMWIATLVVMPCAIGCGRLPALTWKLGLVGLAVAILCSALPFTLELLAMKKIPAKTFSILTSLDPGIAALSGMIFLNEHLTITQCMAIACIVAASFGATASSPER